MTYVKTLIILLAMLSTGLCEGPGNGYTIPDPNPELTPENPSDGTGDDNTGGNGTGDEGTGGGEEPPAVGPSLTFYSISCGPGEDASQSMMISWAVDSTAIASHVEYTKASDVKWSHPMKAEPEQSYFCTDFDGIWSKAADGRDFYEKARFIKYGAALEGLESDMEYKYVIKGEDGSVSREGRFRTAGAGKWSCCIISDFHSYTPLPQRMSSAMGMIDRMEEKDPSLDWILCPGDVVAWGGSYSFWKEFFAQQNCADYMWARVNGNHDNWTREANEVTKEYDIPNYFFKGTSYYPRNGYGEEIGVCYDFRYGNTLFVILNSEDMDSDSEYNAAYTWVRNVVNDARKSADKPEFVVVVMHIEWFLGTDGTTRKYKNWKKVFDELGVDLAVAGDNHVYVRTYPLYNDRIVSDGSKGTVYLQTSSSDNDRGRDISKGTPANGEMFACRWSEGSHSISAIHMEVDGKTMSLKLMDRNGTIQDSTTIRSRQKP